MTVLHDFLPTIFPGLSVSAVPLMVPSLALDATEVQDGFDSNTPLCFSALKVLGSREENDDMDVRSPKHSKSTDPRQW